MNTQEVYVGENESGFASDFLAIADANNTVTIKRISGDYNVIYRTEVNQLLDENDVVYGTLNTAIVTILNSTIFVEEDHETQILDLINNNIGTNTQTALDAISTDGIIHYLVTGQPFYTYRATLLYNTNNNARYLRLRINGTQYDTGADVQIGSTADPVIESSFPALVQRIKDDLDAAGRVYYDVRAILNTEAGVNGATQNRIDIEIDGDAGYTSANATEIQIVTNTATYFSAGFVAGPISPSEVSLIKETINGVTTWTLDGTPIAEPDLSSFASVDILSVQDAIVGKSDIGHTHVKADITDFNEADYATSAQGALADTALQPGDGLVGGESTNFQDLDIDGRLNLGATRNGNVTNGPEFINGANIIEKYSNTNATITGISDANYKDGDVLTYSNESGSAEVTFLHAAPSAGQSFDFADNLPVTIYPGDSISFYYSSSKWRLKDISRLRLSESKITDLDKYTQGEVDAFLATKPTLINSTIDIYVAPDAGSAQPGDFIGGSGIQEAIDEACKYFVQNTAANIIISLRDGTYTLASSLNVSHPQAKTNLILRALNGLTASAFSSIASGVVLNDQSADETLIEGVYNVKIECNSFAFFLDNGSGVGEINDIYFKYVGVSTSRAGIFCKRQSTAKSARCTFLNFTFGIRVSTMSMYSSIGGNNFLYCSSQALRSEASSSLDIVLAGNYSATAHSTSNYACYAVTNSYLGAAGSVTNSTLTLTSSTTNRYVAYIDDKSKGAFTRVKFVGGSVSAGANQNSDISLSSCEFVANSEEAVVVSVGSTCQFSNITVDASGTSLQKTVTAQTNSTIIQTGTHVNSPVFVPAVGSVTDVTSRID